MLKLEYAKLICVSLYNRAFAVIVNALDVRVSGQELLHLVLEPSQRYFYNLRLFVKDTNVAQCLKRHLQTLEGYELKDQGKMRTATSDYRCPNVSEKLVRYGIHTRQEIWEHPVRKSSVTIKVLLSGDLLSGSSVRVLSMVSSVQLMI
jgi:hypothetical protein